MNRLRGACDKWKAQTGLGFGLYGTPAESLCYRFARIDKERFGTIEDVTDKATILTPIMMYSYVRLSIDRCTATYV